MSRTFVNASAMYLEYNGAVLTSTPLTMSCWVKPASIGTASRFVATISKNSGSPGNLIGLSYNNLGKPVAAQLSTAFGQAIHATAMTNGTWFHICGVFTNDSSRTIYLNGINPVTDSTVTSGMLLDTKTDIGTCYQSSSSPSLYVNGDVSDVAFWNVALSSSDVALLASGLSPYLVNFANLKNYWIINGVDSPEIDSISGNSMSLVNAPTQGAANPVIYNPAALNCYQNAPSDNKRFDIIGF